MGLPIGSNLYGAIQQIDKTTIRTKFFTIAFIPILPLGSFYYLEGSETEGKSIPLIYRSTHFTAFEMANLDWKSVFLGYFRASCLLLFLYNIYALFTNWRVGLATLSLLGITALLTSYLMNKIRVDTDSLFVRTLCGKLFGIAVDPKYLAGEQKKLFLYHVNKVWTEEGHGEFVVDRIAEYSPRKLALSLISFRFHENGTAIDNVRHLISRIKSSILTQAETAKQHLDKHFVR